VSSGGPYAKYSSPIIENIYSKGGSIMNDLGKQEYNSISVYTKDAKVAVLLLATALLDITQTDWEVEKEVNDIWRHKKD